VIDALAVLIGIGLLVTVVTVIGAVLHLVFGLLLLPLEIAAWLLKAVLALAIGVVVMALVVPAMVAFLPVAIVLGILALPVLVLMSACAL